MKRPIKRTDAEIECLTEDEIKIVEGTEDRKSSD